ncbi:MAG: dihydrodipicolinate synthase family protein [Desulfobacterales bacterium]
MDAEGSQAPRGLICPLVTPLTAGGELDLPSLERLLGHVHRFADALLVGDLIWGEGGRLSETVRLTLLAAVHDANQGRKPLLVTVTGRHPADTRRFMREAEALLAGSGDPRGVCWVDYPLVYHSNRGLPQFYRDLAADTRFPFIIANHPSSVQHLKGPGRLKNIRTSVLKKVAASPAMTGLIFVGDLKRALNYHLAVRNRDAFTFYDGDERAFLQNPASGGVVAGGSNLLPRIWKAVTRSSLDWLEEGRRFLPHPAGLLESGIMLRTLGELCRSAPAVQIKTILQRVGIIASDAVAVPGVSHDPGWEADLRAFLSAYDLL